MSRAFVAGSSQFLQNLTSPPVTAVPMSFSIWFNPTTSNAIQYHFLLDSGAGTTQAQLRTNASGQVCVGLTDSGGNVFEAIYSAGTVTNGTWAHLAGVWVNTVNYRAYLNGAASSTPSGAPVTFSATRMELGGVATFYSNGLLAEAGLWNVVLDDSEIAALAKGFAPPLIRPQSLQAYWPLYGENATELDRWRNKYDLTVTGATNNEGHPHMIYHV